MDTTTCPEHEADTVKTWDVDSNGRAVTVYVCRQCPWELTKPAN